MICSEKRGKDRETRRHVTFWWTNCHSGHSLCFQSEHFLVNGKAESTTLSLLPGSVSQPFSEWGTTDKSSRFVSIEKLQATIVWKWDLSSAKEQNRHLTTNLKAVASESQRKCLHCIWRTISLRTRAFQFTSKNTKHKSVVCGPLFSFSWRFPNGERLPFRTTGAMVNRLIGSELIHWARNFLSLSEPQTPDSSAHRDKLVHSK